MYRFNDRVTLISAGFRIFHILLIIGSGFLLYSALGLDDEGGGGSLNMFLLHREIGLLWGFVIIAYAGYAVLKRRKIRIIEPLDKPVTVQIKEAFSIIGRYFFGRGIPGRVRKNMGRHNILASYAFLLLVAGLILLGVGGLGLIITGADAEGSNMFLIAHILGAGMLALFVLSHLFAVINRENRPLLSAVFTNGKVRREWVEEAMPSFAEEHFRD